MIAFGCCVGTPETFAAWAAPGIARVAEPDSVLAQVTDQTSIHAAYNELLDAFAPREDLEALVLLHEDCELFDEDFCDRVRAELADPAVAILGAVGARNVTSLAWWEGEKAGRVWETRAVIDGGIDNPVVDAVDGLLMVLSPWAVRELRCDTERYDGFHGYDIDLCFQARCAGREVRVADLSVFHHTKGGYGDRSAWERANDAFVRKWARVSSC